MKPTSTRQLCAYQRGYQAAKGGKDRLANPHNRNTVGWTWWIKGFEAGGKCTTCGGLGVVDDGEIAHSAGGLPYENGPVKCVKDCRVCSRAGDTV